MKTINNLPFLDHTDGPFHDLVISAINNGAVSSNSNNETFELTFEKAADAKAFSDKVAKIIPKVMENDPVDDPDQPAE